MKTLSSGKSNLIFFVLLLLLFFVFALSLFIGIYDISFSEFLKIIFAKITGQDSGVNPVSEVVLFQVRIPRIIGAIIIGASLSLAGTTFQGVFRNPMVSPDILGASAGAGFGAALAILLSFNSLGIQISAFVFSLLAVAITCLIGFIVGRKRDTVLVLVLTGIVVAALFSSLISMAKYLADTEEQLPAITFWLMGGLSAINLYDLKTMLLPFLLGTLPIFFLKWKLNILTFGEEEAKSMGIDIKKVVFILIISSTLLTASAVSVGGIIGWVGLIIPHIARILVGPNHSRLLLASMLIGGIFLLCIDNIARSAFTVEIPLGILTALVGAPFFLYILFKGKKGWI